MFVHESPDPPATASSARYSWACSSWRTICRSAMSSIRHTTIGTSPEMPCAHSTGAAALTVREDVGWRAERRIRVEHMAGQALEQAGLVRDRCRGGTAGPAPASRPGCRPARTRRRRDACRPGRARPSREAATSVQNVTCAAAPGRQPDAAPQAEHRDRARRRTCWRGAGRRRRRSARGCRVRVPGSAPGRFRIARCRPPPPRRRPGGPPRPAARPDDRRRRVASSAPMSATNSVCTNSLEKAGWAASAAPVARTISAYDVTSISRVRCPSLEIVTRRASASSSGETITSSLVVIVPSRLTDVDAVFEERRLVPVGLDAAGLVARRPHRAAVDVAKEDVRAPAVARRVLAPAGDREVAPAAVARSRRRHHHRVPAVGQQVRPARRAGAATGSGGASAARVRERSLAARASSLPRDGRRPPRAACVPAAAARLPGRSARRGSGPASRRRAARWRARSPSCPGGAP